MAKIPLPKPYWMYDFEKDNSKDEYAIKFAQWLNEEFKFKLSPNAFENLLIIYKKEQNGQI